MNLISEQVREVVERSPLLISGLQQDILSLAKTARMIQGILKRTTKKSISESAVSMELSRLKSRLAKVAPHSTAVTIQNISLTIHLFAATFRNSDASIVASSKLHAVADERRRYFATTQSERELSIMADAALKSDMDRLMPSPPRAFLPKIAAINIVHSEKDSLRPGIVHLISQLLSVSGISLVEIATTHTEIVLYVEQHQAKAAFNLLHGHFIEG